NQVAELAAMANHAPYSGPLVVIPDTGADPQMDLPTAVFYSDRESILLSVPADDNKLSGLLGSSKSLDALIQKGALGEVSQLYLVRLNDKCRDVRACQRDVSVRRVQLFEGIAGGLHAIFAVHLLRHVACALKAA